MTKSQVHSEVRQWIIDLLRQRAPLLDIMLRQRAKFEGWLKFELADIARHHGAEVTIEPPLPCGGGRADLEIRMDGQRTFVELKTANTNWRVEGIANKVRPITKNIASIAGDIKKLGSSGGVVASLLFPIPKGDRQWERYVKQISEECGIPLVADENVCVIEMPDCAADVLLLAVSTPQAETDAALGRLSRDDG